MDKVSSWNASWSTHVDAQEQGHNEVITARQLPHNKKITRAKKFCVQCGLKIVGRAGLHYDRIRDATAEKMGLVNSEYQYVHLKCEPEFEANLAAGRTRFLTSYTMGVTAQ